MSASLHSAPEENYSDHISRCMEKYNLIFPNYLPTIIRIFNSTIDKQALADNFFKMILFHDLGKLTKRWQQYVGTNNKLPSHATIGAAYLYHTLPEELRKPLSFAVAIHHTDKGLLGDNIEKPDVQAILDGIVDYNGNINWQVDEVNNLPNDYFPTAARNINVMALKEMARGLRVWAKGCNLLEQHKRRIQSSLAHHILKLCDISAASERKDYKKQNEHDYYGGWLMVENIKQYVNAISERSKQ